MGSKKFRKPVLLAKGEQHPVQALTGASSGTAVRGYGVTRILSTGNGGAGTIVYTLSAPELAGITKTIVVDNNSTKLIQVRTPSSGDTFYGTTKNAVQWTTGSTSPPSSVSLLAISTQQWAVMALATPGSTVAPAVSILGATA